MMYIRPGMLRSILRYLYFFYFFSANFPFLAYRVLTNRSTLRTATVVLHRFVHLNRFVDQEVNDLELSQVVLRFRGISRDVFVMSVKSQYL